MKILIISPSSADIYQDLAKDFSAKEPNIWAGLLANSIRHICDVSIYDIEIERPTLEEFCDYCRGFRADFILFVVTGQNPNASSAAMSGATKAAEIIQGLSKIGFVGPHINALPMEVMQKHDFIDIAFTNEGVYALKNIASRGVSIESLKTIKGIIYRDGADIIMNDPERIVPQERLEIDLPGIAYDLMPPLSKYRTSNWHTNFKGGTSPFASIYTSLGCFAKCNFCIDGNTKIVFANEQSKDIKKVCVGDILMAWDESINDYAETEVINTSKRVTNEIYRIEYYRNGIKQVIRCTGEHPFYVNGNWIDAKNLAIGDELFMMGKYDKNQFRMKKNNPSFDSKIALRAAKTRRDNGHVPYMCTKDGIEKIKIAAKKRASSGENPMLLEHNRKAASERMSGENNPCWAGGISKMYIEYPQEFNTRLKRKIRKRDGFCCQECNKNNCRLDVHHIDYDKTNNHECNLLTLCMSCHMKTNYDRTMYTIKYKTLQQTRGFCPILAKIHKIEVLKETRNVFNLECSPHNNYFANKTLVHNCMINIINRTSNENLASNSFNVFRYWSPEFTIKQMEYLAEQGVTNLKIADEMFVYRPAHFMELCKLIIERGLKFNIWAYSRVDTAKPHYLETLKAAGVNHLALGIESASQTVRQEIDKGRFKEINIRDLIGSINDHGIGVGGNFIFGLPTDTYETMQQTVDLAFDLELANMNVYCSTALPGSPLYLEAKAKGRQLPTEYSEFGFLSYDHIPDSTDALSSKEVLAFRDNFFHEYFTSPKTLSMIEKKYGPVSTHNIRKMTDIRLKRKLLGD